MKNLLTKIFCLFLFWATDFGYAQNSFQLPVPDSTVSSSAVVERGPHHRVLQRIHSQRLNHRTLLVTNRITEMASGMHGLSNGSFVPSNVTLINSGGLAVGQAGLLSFDWAPNLNSFGAVQVQLQDGGLLRSHVLGLFLHDTVTGEIVQIASIQNSEGEIDSGSGNIRTVTYPNAFRGLSADVRYTFSRGHFEQDVILREKPPESAAFGFNPETTRLEVLTEFIEPPTPELHSVRLPHPKMNRFMDTEVVFGNLRLGTGEAFALEGECRGGAGRPGSLHSARLHDYGGSGGILPPDGAGRPDSLHSARLHDYGGSGGILPPDGAGRPGSLHSKDFVTLNGDGAHGVTRPTLQVGGVVSPLTDCPRKMSGCECGVSSSPRVSVGKSWIEDDGRVFLLESVWLDDLAEPFKKLPIAQSPLPVLKPIRSTSRIYPPAPSRPRTDGALKLASLDLRPGVVIDYRVDIQGASNFVFKSGETYLITGPTYLYGHTQFEGGSVIKYVATNNAALSLSGTFEFATGAYLPVFFTSMDDNLVGETVSGSTGSPMGYYADVALKIEGNGAISNAFFRHARTALQWSRGEGILSHVQVLKSGTVVNGAFVDLQIGNALVSGVDKGFVGNDTQIRGYHLTLDNANSLAALVAGSGGSALRLTNCILSNITSLGAVPLLAVDYSATYQTPALPQRHPTLLTASPFANFGPANHYLPSTTALRNIGTIELPPMLIKEIRSRTVYPPVLLSNIILNASVTYTNRSLADVDVPDLGYHYSNVDYVFHRVAAFPSHVRLLPGVSVAVAGKGIEYGLGLLEGGKLHSHGTAEAPVNISSWTMIMEPSQTWLSSDAHSFVTTWRNETSPPEALFRFTHFNRTGTEGAHVYGYYGNTSKISLRDCAVTGGKIILVRPPLEWNNTLFHRVQTLVDGFDYPIHLTVSHSHFEGGKLLLYNYSSEAGLLQLNDCWFNLDTLEWVEPLQHSHNGYSLTSPRFEPVAASDIVGSPHFQSGWFGRFYQTGPSMLTDKGSRSAAAAGLYHYGAMPGVAEGATTADIGLHYPVASSIGVPKDSDKDGLPDYLEDSNGDGVVDSRDGLEDWDGDGVINRSDSRLWNPLINDYQILFYVPRPASRL